MSVIAEGVDRAPVNGNGEQQKLVGRPALERVIELGIDNVQGWIFAPAMTQSNFLAGVHSGELLEQIW